MFPYHTVPIT